MEERTLPQTGVGRWLREAMDAAVGVFFPADCRICKSLLTRASRIPICADCLGSFQPIPSPACDACGQPLLPTLSPSEWTSPARCRVCLETPFAFDKARSFAFYQDQLVRAILLLKFERMAPLGAWFASKLAALVEREGETLAPDLVVPVPLHRNREKERGYNQADLLAGPLAKRLGLPHRPVLLVRSKPRPDKHVLSLEERWAAVRGAFATQPGTQVDNMRVLLVDDVMTTGATLDACAKALREAGAKSVIGLTVARAVSRGLPAVGKP